jgi:hypothetical protein
MRGHGRDSGIPITVMRNHKRERAVMAIKEPGNLGDLKIEIFAWDGDLWGALPPSSSQRGFRRLPDNGGAMKGDIHLSPLRGHI